MIEQLELTNINLHKLCVNNNAANMQKVFRESVHLEEYLCDNYTLQLAMRDTFV